MKLRTTILAIVLVALIVSSTLAVYFMFARPNGRVNLSLLEGDAYLASDGRHITIIALNSGETNITLDGLTINGSSIYTWISVEQYLTPSQNTTVDILFHWTRDTVYNVSLIASSAEETVSASILVLRQAHVSS